MSQSPYLPNYAGVRLPENMNPYKAGSLLMKVATAGSSDGKAKKGKGGGGKKGLSKTMVKTITGIKK
jgi:hypothetical protein